MGHKMTDIENALAALETANTAAQKYMGDMVRAAKNQSLVGSPSTKDLFQKQMDNAFVAYEGARAASDLAFRAFDDATRRSLGLQPAPR